MWLPLHANKKRLQTVTLRQNGVSAMERKYKTSAARQAAYRKRKTVALQAQLKEKALPPLPAVPSMPGNARWLASLKAAEHYVRLVYDEMTDYFDDRSEAWQEGERGEEFKDRLTAIEAVVDSLGELI